MENTTKNSKRALKRRCGSVMVYYASPTLIASVLLKLIEFVLASNNDTQGTSIVFSDTSIYNLTHNTKPGIEGECLIQTTSLLYSRISNFIEESKYASMSRLIIDSLKNLLRIDIIVEGCGKFMQKYSEQTLSNLSMKLI